MQVDSTIGLTTSTQLNRELIEQALEKTPTGGNAKPFSWVWLGDVLYVHHSESLAEHYLNPNFHASWIALGALIASVEIAAKAQGWGIEERISKNLFAEILFSRTDSGRGNPETVDHLLTRSTYRGPLQASPVPAEIQSQEESIKLHLAAATDLNQDFKKYLMTSDTYMWLQKKALMSFFKEVRFFDNQLEPRGIRSQDLGIGLMDQVILYIFSFVPWLLTWIARIPGLNQNFKSASKRSLENAHFLLITAKDLSPAGLVNAGKEALRAWVKLEAQGYKAQPYSMASLSLVAAKTGHLNQDTISKFRQLFTVKAPDIVRRQFNLRSDENPVWLLRVGQPSHSKTRP